MHPRDPGVGIEGLSRTEQCARPPTFPTSRLAIWAPPKRLPPLLLPDPGTLAVALVLAVYFCLGRTWRPTRIPDKKQVMRDVSSSSEYDTSSVVRHVRRLLRQQLLTVGDKGISRFMVPRFFLSPMAYCEMPCQRKQKHIMPLASSHDFNCCRLSPLLLQSHTRLGRVGQHLTHRCSYTRGCRSCNQCLLGSMVIAFLSWQACSCKAINMCIDIPYRFTSFRPGHAPTMSDKGELACYPAGKA